MSDILCMNEYNKSYRHILKAIFKEEMLLKRPDCDFAKTRNTSDDFGFDKN